MRKFLAVTCAVIFFTASAHAAVFNPQTKTLANGMQVIVVENHRAPVVTHMIWMAVGSADETPGKSGLAHYLEHLMFKATKNHPAGYYSKMIASVGGSENAFTSFDYTGFYAVVARENLPLVMQLESDRFANLVIDPKEATPELQVVIDEKRQRVDSDPYAMFTQRMQTLLHPHHPYSIPTIGWPDEIEKLTPEDARAFYQRWYHPQNATLVVSGDVKATDVFAIAEKYYTAWPKEESAVRARVKDPVFPGKLRFDMQEPRIRERLIELTQPAPSRRQNREMSYALEVLHEMIDGSNAAYLPDLLVNKKALATSIDVDYDTDAYDGSAFNITAVPKGDASPEVLTAAIKDALKTYAEQPVDEKALAAAKLSLQRQAELARDSVTGPAYAFGVASATGQSVADVEEWPAHIAAVTPAQITAALQQIIKIPFIMGVIRPQPGAAPAVDETPPPILHGGGSLR